MARLFGSTVPFSVAADAVMLEAAPVVTSGGTVVVKTASVPWLVPAPFVATTR